MHHSGEGAIMELWGVDNVYYDYRYFCGVYLQEPKREVLLMKPFSYNHSNNDTLARLNNTIQRDLVLVKAKTLIFIKI